MANCMASLNACACASLVGRACVISLTSSMPLALAQATGGGTNPAKASARARLATQVRFNHVTFRRVGTCCIRPAMGGPSHPLARGSSHVLPRYTPSAACQGLWRSVLMEVGVRSVLVRPEDRRIADIPGPVSARPDTRDPAGGPIRPTAKCPGHHLGSRWPSSHVSGSRRGRSSSTRPWRRAISAGIGWERKSGIDSVKP